jgi:hypothetical protein
MRDVRTYDLTNSQLDSIKTAGGRISGDGNFYIHSKEGATTLTTFLAIFMVFYNATGIGKTSARGGNIILRLTVPIPRYNQVKMRSRQFLRMRPQEFQMRPHLFPATQRTREPTRTTLSHSQTRRTHSTTLHTLSQLPHHHLTARPKRQANVSESTPSLPSATLPYSVT